SRSCDACFDRRKLALELVEVGPRRAQHGVGVTHVAFRLLRQERDDEAAAARYVARVGCLLAGKDPKEGRLAAAVRADHAQADARLDVEIEPVEDLARAEALRDAAHGEDGHRGTVPVGVYGSRN